MEPIYLDNASTSFPKPPQVAQAMFDYVTGCGCNIGRAAMRGVSGGGDGAAHPPAAVPPVPRAGQPMRGVHQEHHRKPERPAKGPAAARGHVLVSAMEHNAVMRPLTQLTRRGVTFDRIPAARTAR